MCGGQQSVAAAVGSPSQRADKEGKDDSGGERGSAGLQKNEQVGMAQF